ncbi:bifunctional 3-(3-hydroxy-phenyl)propionate/3-hydroxycinnamic acid hydroxylase [Sphingobium subterraneum]|uniref:2-polyprenyl-6-methoxyphenol hydroxylase-like FAD-dependent oxidoreductase n=1 Tax=Sphingobium subterraneum TaxID=627688 RepID=A0A841J0K1_9SPHN|nr:2-polyprenyl-6-methoxyphenol hydroxylase-like FAD-dependent oxidoreductase [Sphingobium subterraneum]
MNAYDLAIIGYGPTGMMLAALMGRLGHRVVVLERYAGLYNFPRAACFDDEIMRMFQKLGVAGDVAEGAVVQRGYDWINADGEVLVQIDYPNPALNGWAALYMMFQPHIEDVLDSLDKTLPTVEVRQGVAVNGLEQDADGVTIETDQQGQKGSVRARYVVGADGGNGFTQRAFRRRVADYGFEENWLVCDFEMLRPVPGLPTFQQVCDPAQPISIVTIGPRHHRFSFMLNRDESPEEATQPERVWQRVSGYITPDDATLIRAVNYVFRSRIGDTWRHGRVMLAGDAAHEMPPFLGQGMCSGMRDAHNLAWKLDLLLKGRAEDSVLDSYQVEREPHVRFITEKAIELGRVQTIRDPQQAKERDERLLNERRAHKAPAKLAFPALSGGLIINCGKLFPQARVADASTTSLFDDIVGSGWILVTRDADLLATVDSDALAIWKDLGGRSLTIGGSRSPDMLADTDGVYTQWFEENDCTAAIVRPDWYVLATGSSGSEISHHLLELARRLNSTERPTVLAAGEQSA